MRSADTTPAHLDRHPNGRSTASILQRLGVTEDFVAVRTQHDRFTDVAGATVQGHKKPCADILDGYPPFGPESANPTAASRMAQLTRQDALNVILVPGERVAEVLNGQRYHRPGHSWITFPLRTALERGAQVYPDTGAVRDETPWMKPVIIGLPEGTRLPVDITAGPGATPVPATQPGSTAIERSDDFGRGLVEGAHGWTKVGDARGSTRGGVFRSPDGTQWYVKTPQSVDHVRNEVLAARLYTELGVYVPSIKPISIDGRMAIASRMLPDARALSPDLEARVADGFVADAWLANWDVAGAGNLKAMHVAGGAPIGPFRIDVGGALLHRAMGEPKGAAFGKVVGEVDSLRDARINPAAARLFRHVGDTQLRQGIQRVASLPDARIWQLVVTHGPGTLQAREALAELLIARKQDLVDKVRTLDSRTLNVAERMRHALSAGASRPGPSG